MLLGWQLNVSNRALRYVSGSFYFLDITTHHIVDSLTSNAVLRVKGAEAVRLKQRMSRASSTLLVGGTSSLGEFPHLTSVTFLRVTSVPTSEAVTVLRQWLYLRQ